jgi:HAD superfamily hydrolase (TIGR01549 family)
MALTGRSYKEDDFDRWFRRVYQHFGSPRGYEVLPDVATFLDKIPDSYVLGICSNTPNRHSASVLPMLGIHERFKFFACSQDVGHEKPHPEIFEAAFRQMTFELPDLKRDEVLHVGDSLACDFYGAKAYGFQALFLDRSGNEKRVAYQDWVQAPEYPGKDAEDIDTGTVRSLADVVALIELSNAEPGAFIRVI